MPARAWFRFYAELNDHLAPDQRYRALERTLDVPASVKDGIESFGVPHTEVELVVVNGESSDFGRIVLDGDRVAVYPVFESFDITPELRVRTGPLRDLKFVLDVHLGKLAAYLRMLGFDTAYRNCASDPELVQTAERGQVLGLVSENAAGDLVALGRCVQAVAAAGPPAARQFGLAAGADGGGGRAAHEHITPRDLGRGSPFPRPLGSNA